MNENQNIHYNNKKRPSMVFDLIRKDMKSLFIKGKTTIFFKMNPKHINSLPIIASVITVSSSRTRENDTSGNAIRDILTTAGIKVEHYAIIPDNIESIRSEIYYSIENSNCVIINGGRGLTHDDCTIEAVTPLLEKKIDGFGELFRE